MYLPSCDVTAADTEHIRARKRQRIEGIHVVADASSSTVLATTDHRPQSTTESRTDMRLPGSDQDSTLSVSLDSTHEAGPSSVPLDGIPPSNGHANGNRFSITNGSSGPGMVTGNGIHKPTKGIRRVSLPGTTLYDDSHIDRQEFVRLVIQSLRDVGYMCVTHPCPLEFS
jgi:hypothetical protein